MLKTLHPVVSVVITVSFQKTGECFHKMGYWKLKMVVQTSYPSNREVEYKSWKFSAILTYSLAVDET